MFTKYVRERDRERERDVAYDSRSANDKSIVVCEWYDNMLVASHITELTQLIMSDGVLRSTFKCHYLPLIKIYNANMGGLNKCNIHHIRVL